MIRSLVVRTSVAALLLSACTVSSDAISTGGPSSSAGLTTTTTGLTAATETGDGTDATTGTYDLGSSPDAPDTTFDPCGNTLQGTLRDFSQSHPDFEYVIGEDPGIVADVLGVDGKPVYNGNPTTPSTNGKEAFDQWYRDVPGVNVTIPLSIPLTDQGGGIYTYDNPAFFPIDEQGLGNEGNEHNYHFTYEIATEFTYHGGEVFTFTGDDDLFTFINGKLAIDLGGVHGPLTGTVDLDAQAAALGIVPGQKYSLHFFFAERHTSESNFRIDTTIDCFLPPPK
ncbi:MAG: fibro-slime domain-containing protein [Nannocystaceae bacterium]